MNRLVYLFVIVLCGITACSQNSQAENDTVLETVTPTTAPLLAQSSANGETIYIVYCAKCHGLNGEGENPEDPFKGDAAPPHDETGHTWHHDDDLLIQIITEGGISNRMPAFEQQLNPEQVELVLEYIKTFWTDDQRAYQAEVTQMIRDQ